MVEVHWALKKELGFGKFRRMLSEPLGRMCSMFGRTPGVGRVIVPLK